eukprot:Plantae.Rhodophyta-Palmaria_palmata.ctg8174.p1 GENE.Plantae.Rhodophyta-Palmaria_palmata.ctg8174~~Plantae.Rhodophyta-Palmaria_palmata.ctg8174.p1  ORF type:complete len:389 (+),score=105.19 Plantae.Rhodophyta-Palmaria_palmata.ctg8174:141-1169(+)
MKDIKGKIACAVAAKTFNEEAVEVIRNMDTFAMIPTEIMNSNKLSHMLECILAMGNFLNSGTGRGGAHGFKLEALAMLNNVKDAKGDTLLDFIVRWNKTERPGVLPIDDMPTLSRSATISLEAIGDSVGTLIQSVTDATAQINSIGDDPALATFKTEMVDFATDAVKVKDEIVSLRALMMEKLQLMMAHFGERNKAARGRQEDVLRMLREFQDELGVILARDAEKEERDAKKTAKVNGGKAPIRKSKYAASDKGGDNGVEVKAEGGGGIEEAENSAPPAEKAPSITKIPSVAKLLSTAKLPSAAKLPSDETAPLAGESTSAPTLDSHVTDSPSDGAAAPTAD